MNIEGTCKHAYSFKHVQNFHMHFLDYKILPHHFLHNIHIGFPKLDLQWHMEIKN
jgi:hypothetical protein